MPQFKEQAGNLWDFVLAGNVIVIPTNGEVNAAGKAVMGKGVAQQARDRYPGVDLRLGKLIQTYGSRCFRLPMSMLPGDGSRWTLASFPTKRQWREPSDVEIIAESAWQLVEMANKFAWTSVYLPQVGTGEGGLTWGRVVLCGSLDVLDDRFTVLYQEKSA